MRLIIDMDNELRNTIAYTLHRFGIASNIKGYYYLIDAIMLVMNNDKFPVQMTNGVYNVIAKKYGSSLASIERCIRFAIEEGFTKASSDAIKEIFSSTIAYNKAKPTNSQFIHMIAEECKRKTN